MHHSRWLTKRKGKYDFRFRNYHTRIYGVNANKRLEIRGYSPDQLKQYVSERLNNQDCVRWFKLLIDQYNEICEECSLKWEDPGAKLQNHDMWSWIEMSVDFLSGSTKYQGLMAEINQLADRWNTAKYERTGKRWPKPRHRFFLSDNTRDSDPQRPYTVRFNPSDNPDDRVVLIVIDGKNSPGQNFEEILHEVGHYIGCRRRKNSTSNGKQPDSRLDYCQRMIVLEWINTIYQYMCADIVGVKFEEVYPGMRGDVNIEISKRTTMDAVLSALTCNDYYEYMLETLKSGMNQLKLAELNKMFQEVYPERKYFTAEGKVLLAALEEPIENDKAEIRNKRRKLAYLDHGYFDIEKKYAIDVFLTLIRDPKRIDDLRKIFKKSCPKKNRAMMLNRYDQAMKKISDKIEQIYQEAKHDGRIEDKYLQQGFIWVSLPVFLLEEIAADVFLCKFGRMEKTYLFSILKAYALQYSESKTENLSEEARSRLLNNDSHRHRLIAVAAALGLNEPYNNEGSANYSIEFELIRRANIIKRMKQLYRNEGETENQQSFRMLQVENPAILAEEYASTILNDKRYAEFIENPKNGQLIRTLLSYNH